MKLYIAAKQPIENDVRRFVRALESNGHEITLPWWDEAWEPVKPEAHWELTARMLDAIDAADALVLIPPATGGLGCFIETGYAVGKQKDVYVVRLTSVLAGDDLLAALHDRKSSFFHNEDIVTSCTGTELLDTLRA